MVANDTLHLKYMSLHRCQKNTHILRRVAFREAFLSLVYKGQTNKTLFTYL